MCICQIYDPHFKPTHSLKTKCSGSPNENKNNKNHGSWPSWPHLIPDPLHQLASSPTNSWKVRSQRCTQRQAKQSPERRFIWKTWSSKEVENSPAKKNSSQSPDCQLEIRTGKLKLFQQNQHYFNIRHKEVFWDGTWVSKRFRPSNSCVPFGGLARPVSLRVCTIPSCKEMTSNVRDMRLDRFDSEAHTGRATKNCKPLKVAALYGVTK